MEGKMPFEIRYSDKIGRHFVAQREILPNEVILIDRPLVMGPSTKTKPVCLGCLKVLDESSCIKCRNCRFPLCSAECSEHFWHMEECGSIKNFDTSKVSFDQDNNLVYSVIFLARILILRQKNPDDYATISNFASSFKKEVFESFLKETADTLKVFGYGEIDQDELAHLMGIKRTNAYNLDDKLEGKNGTAIYSVFPLMNHSCCCNTDCHIDIKDLSMTITAKVPIQQGEEISTSYISMLEIQPRRQMILWRNWNFICQCKRCQDPDELDTGFSSLRCMKCSSGWLTPMFTTMLASPWSCGNCPFKCGHREIVDKLDTFELIMNQDISLHKKLSLLSNHLHDNHGIKIRLVQSMIKQRKKELSREMLENSINVLEKLKI